MDKQYCDPIMHLHIMVDGEPQIKCGNAWELSTFDPKFVTCTECLHAINSE